MDQVSSDIHAKVYHYRCTRRGGGGGVDESSPLRFFDMLQYLEKILPPVESFSSSRQDEVIISWVVALLETCNVTNMAAILDLTPS